MSARSTALWVVVGILLLLAAVPPLLVPVYARLTPTLWGFPFYFWFQFVLVIWAALMTSGAYVIGKEASRRDRAARTGNQGGAR
jgi:membrane protein implicated in regulation of membrane protease activity